MTAGVHWSSVSEAGALFGLKVMFWVYRWCGRLPFRLILYPVILYYALLRKSARLASRQYLETVRQRQAGSLKGPVGWLIYRHFMSFGDSILDKLAVWQGDIGLDQVAVQNHESFDALVAEGRGGILIGSHLGNLEICRALSQRNTGVTFNVLMHTAHATKFNDMLRRVSNASQVNIIQVEDVNPATAIVLQEKLDSGEFLVIAGDRTPPTQGNNTIPVTFLGHECEFPQGPFILASILKCPVMTIFCLRREKNRQPFYDLYIDALAEKVDLPRRDRLTELMRYAQLWADRLEHYCNKTPLQWYNFYSFWAQPHD